MDLERLAVRLRPRTDWEAIDLGLILVRRWWRPVYGVWLTLTVPAALGLILALGFWGYLLFWWCLPLFEVVALDTLSRAVFGTVPPWAETLKRAPALWRRAWPELLLRRLHPSRGLRLPVGQLEELGGSAWRQRVAVLGTGAESASVLMTLCFLAFEVGLVAALVTFFVMLTPSWMGFDWELLLDRFFAGTLAPLAYKVWWLLVAGVVILLEPFYVGTGFSAYLNRRTRLEGWDLEIAFRRLARRLSGVASEEDRGPRQRGTTGVVAAALLLMFVIGPSPGHGNVVAEVETIEQSAAVPWPGDPERDPRRVVVEVMKLPELESAEVVERWELRQDLFDWLADSESGSSEPSAIFQVLAAFVGLVIRFAEPIAWTVGLLVLFLLLRAAWRHLPEPVGRDREPTKGPELLFGLDLRPESLPDDIPATARDLWAEGEAAAALSLLYRGALARLGAEGLVLREGFTEDDCLRSARRKVTAERAGYFAELTRVWQQVAYGHRVPESAVVGRIWEGWADHFGDTR